MCRKVIYISLNIRYYINFYRFVSFSSPPGSTTIVTIHHEYWSVIQIKWSTWRLQARNVASETNGIFLPPSNSLPGVLPPSRPFGWSGWSGVCSHIRTLIPVTM